MIIIKLQGGLGNQMFQYALGRSLSLTYQKLLKVDSSFFRTANQSDRTLRIDGFNVELIEATPAEINIYRGTVQKILDRFRPKPMRKTILEISPRFKPDILKRNDGYFDGYFNSEEYFKAHTETIRKDFTLKHPLSIDAESIKKNICSASCAIAVHIRRGDYVRIAKVNSVHGVLPLSYYTKSCDYLLKQFPHARFFIFSDDIEWAKNNFPQTYPTTFVSKPTIPDYEEMTLMSLCHHNILANSTFSWWGAWLNQHPEKIVVAPKQWFADKTKDTTDLLPKSFTVITF